MTSVYELPRPAAEGPAILLVDDEIAILDGLRRQLRKKFTVHTATSGAQGLELLGAHPVSVVVSDMRMPQMDGATFLSRVRTLHPDVVRILLTGQADTQAAITAVNEGQIYRFLTKPCPPDVLLQEITNAVELNRLATAEKELLATTLRQTVEALTTTLSLAQPVAFGRAVRITRTVAEIAEEMPVQDQWELEITAMLTQLGCVTLPPNVLAKLDAGRPLNEDESEMLARVPEISRTLVASIPRLEHVADAIRRSPLRYDGLGSPLGAPKGPDLPLASRILRAAVDFDSGVAQRPSVQDTLAVMTRDSGAYDPEVLSALKRCHDTDQPEGKPLEVQVDRLEEGMVISEDIRTTDDILLINRGTVVTEALVVRLENYARQDRVGRTVRVVG